MRESAIEGVRVGVEETEGVGRGRRLRWGLVAGGLLCAALAAAFIAPPRASSSQLFGFNDNTFLSTKPSLLESNVPSLPGTDVAALERQAGAEVQRIPVSWDVIEPGLCKSKGQDWSLYDKEVAALRDNGIRPLFIFWDAPQWAWGELGCGVAGAQPLCYQTRCHVPPGDRFLSAWQTVAGQLATRYPNAAAIEVWNEQNGDGFWQVTGGPDPARYARLFNAAAAGVHTANQANGTKIPVLTGGLAQFSADEAEKAMTISRFLREFSFHGGGKLLEPQDAIGAHAYPEGLDVTAFHQAMKEYRDIRDQHLPGRHLWLTETGITSVSQASGGMTEAKQAQGLVDLKHHVATMDDVDAMIIHSMVESYYGTAEAKAFGVVRRSLQPKPAFCALADDQGGTAPAGCRA